MGRACFRLMRVLPPDTQLVSYLGARLSDPMHSFCGSEELRYHSAMLAAIIPDEMGRPVSLHEGGGAGPITNGTFGNVQADHRMDTIAECHSRG